MKTAISVPDDIYEAAEALANNLGWSRSKLYSRALKEFLEKKQIDLVTQKLDELADEIVKDTRAEVNIGKELIDSGVWEW